MKRFIIFATRESPGDPTITENSLLTKSNRNSGLGQVLLTVNCGI